MSGSLKSVAIYTRKDDDKIKQVVVSLTEKLKETGFKTYLVSSIKHRFAKSLSSISDLKKVKLDIIFTVGGDGTLLWILREMNNTTPILGVNVGRRGILSEVKPDDIDESIENIRKKRFFIENHMRISASIGSKKIPPALNELYFNRISQTRTSTYSIFIQKFTISQKMDGVMVSTPTGSTGHSLSLGGPFIYLTEPAFLITPVASINRLPPIVLPAEPIEIVSDHDAVLVLDGQQEFKVRTNEKVVIRKHEIDAGFIRFKDEKMRQLENLGLLSDDKLKE